jgi:CDGSH-type Zn-finger protein
MRAMELDEFGGEFRLRERPGPESGHGEVLVRVLAVGADGQFLTWQTHEDIPTEEMYALCQCGRSGAKPFCDGSHARPNSEGRPFDGSEAPNMRPYAELQHSLCRTTEIIEPDLQPAISVLEEENGLASALWVTGRVPVERTDGQPVEARNRTTLCRCGHSSNKPLCDGTHRQIGFHE